MLKNVAIVLGLAMLCASCQKYAEGQQMFRELLVLRDQLATEFHENVVDVSRSAKGGLTVKFVNSPLNSATREAKQKRADEVATFVISHSRHPVSSVSTQFASDAGQETYLGRPAPKP